MGVKKFLELISKNQRAVCSEYHVRGELIIDGYALHHHLYDKYDLEWANEGRYAQQCQVTLEYFEKLRNLGIQPVVVVDGGGDAELFDEVLPRRKETIRDLPEMIEKKHLGRDTKRIMPLMAREIFVSSLRESGIKVYAADGKATKTIVYLANHYKCPVLVNNTNYCVCNVMKGVIFFDKFDVETGKAYVYEQTKFTEFFGLRNPDLLCAVWAIMGEGNSIPFLYHGRIKKKIQDSLGSTDFKGRPYVLNVLDFLAKKKFASFEECKESRQVLDFGRQYNDFVMNCRKMDAGYKSKYYCKSSSINIDEFCKSTSIGFPGGLVRPRILEGYRNGTFPVIAVNAMVSGKQILEHCVGDQDQPPTSTLGRPVRQLIYGLVSNLMEEAGHTQIEEHHPRNDGALEYTVTVVTPSCKYKELMVTDLYCKGDKTKSSLCVQVICEVLECPESIVHMLEGNEAEKALILVTLATYSWAKHLRESQQFPNPEQLIKALVVNFFLNLSAPGANREPEIDCSLYSNSDWIKVYHALLVWMSLYRNIHSLNAMLYEPLQPRSSYYLFDGPLIIFLALHESPQIIDTTYMSKLTPEEKIQCQKLFELLVV